TINAPGTITDPQWSSDGRWLAYEVNTHSAASAPAQLWVVSSNGRADHVVYSAPGFFAFVWSPVSDTLAALPYHESGAGHVFGGIVTLAIGAPARGSAAGSAAGAAGGSAGQPAPTQVVPASTPVESFVWSPGGRRFAYSLLPGSPAAGASSNQSAAGRLFIVPASGGRAALVAYAPPTGDATLLASWWPRGNGLLAWVEPGGSPAGASRGLPLVSIPLGTASSSAAASSAAASSGAGSVAAARGGARVLATTVVFEPWVAWQPGGNAVAVVTGGGMSPASGKSIALCYPQAGSCRELPQPAGTVSLDPSWSPRGHRLAFVRAPAHPGPPGPGWSRARRLWVANVGAPSPGSTTPAVPPAAHPVAGAVGGAILPAWARSGAAIGYSTPSSVRVVSATGGKATTLARGLSGPPNGVSGPDAYPASAWASAAVWARH
ncbi:MAG: TolB family protein, partial [Acidimicrobiales bacterium]